MDEFTLNNIDKYSKRLIDIIAPPESGRKVFLDKYLLLNIFSYFLSGWGIQDELTDTCQYYDIFGQLVTVSYVTNRITNPYHDKGVNEEVKTNSYYVGPVVVMQKRNESLEKCRKK
jgi:hypothetical protein